MRTTIRWSELNRPEKSGAVTVPGLGIVLVSPEDIEFVRQFRGDPSFELVHLGVLNGTKTGKYSLIRLPPQ